MGKAEEEYGVIVIPVDENVVGKTETAIYQVDHEATAIQREKMNMTTHKDKPLFNFGFKTNIRATNQEIESLRRQCLIETGMDAPDIPTQETLKNWSSSSGNKGNGNKDPTSSHTNPTGACCPGHFSKIPQKNTTSSSKLNEAN